MQRAERIQSLNCILRPLRAVHTLQLVNNHDRSRGLDEFDADCDSSAMILSEVGASTNRLVLLLQIIDGRLKVRSASHPS